MTPELDTLLQRLKAAPLPDRALAGVEHHVWQRIAAQEARPRLAALRLSFQILAITAAFAWGLVIGFSDSTGPQAAPAFLVDVAKLLPQDPGGFLL